jgi:hypothetical protein
VIVELRGGSLKTMAEEVDPLDAFMASVSAELAMADHHLEKEKAEVMEADDPLADYVEKAPAVYEENGEEEEEIEQNDKDIALLPLIDHSSVKYAPFRRDILKVDFHPFPLLQT